jgi:SAM-dependent methyltransferase
MRPAWMPDELGCAGAEHRDAVYVAGYDRKAGFEVGPDVDLLRAHGLGPDSTLVDLGAGTGLLAAAVAERGARVVAVDPSPAMLEALRERGDGVECVEAGFLTYEHAGEPADYVYSRNALHHLPDAWKAIALNRVARLLRRGGVFVLRDIVYSCAPDEFDEMLESWFSNAVTDSAAGWTRAELEEHVRGEHSTFSWLLEPMLERAGFEIRDRWYSDSRAYARYVCVTA